MIGCWFSQNFLRPSYDRFWGNGATTLNITTLSIMTFSIMTLNIKGLHVTLSISETQRKNTLPLCWVSFCWMLLCWISLCWMLLCWMSLCWVYWRPYPNCFYLCLLFLRHPILKNELKIVIRILVKYLQFLHLKKCRWVQIWINCGLYYKKIVTIMSDDSKWSLYYKCSISPTLSLSWCHQLRLWVMLQVVASFWWLYRHNIR